MPLSPALPLRAEAMPADQHSAAVRRFFENLLPEGIDGCQLLDLASSYKYKRPYGDNPDVRDIRDGASLSRFFSAIKTSPQPVKAKLLLLRWRVFQVLSAHEWAQFCVVTETNPTLVRKEIERGVGLALKHLAVVAAETIGVGALPEVVNGIAKIIRAQCVRQLALAPKIRGVML